MKRIYINYLLFTALLFILSLSGCNKERAAEADASYTIENSDSLYAGTAVNFIFEGTGDFVTLYTGDPGKVWGEEGASGFNVTGGSFAYNYSKQGEYTTTFVATSFGNWAEEEVMDIEQQVIIVTDPRNDFAKFSIVKPRQDGIITGNDITFTLSDAVDVTALTINFILYSQDALVYVDDVLQVSKETKQNFTNPVIYTVVAGDGSTKSYTVTINTYPAENGTEIVEFGIEDPERIAAIDAINNELKMYVPNGTSLTSIGVYTLVSEGAVAQIGTKTLKTSSVNVDISAQPTVITVTAENGATADWDLFTDFELAFDTYKFGNLVPEVSGVVDVLARTVTLRVLEGTDLTNLIADYSLLGTGTVEVDGVVQTSGVTANDFTSTVTYDMILADGASVEFVVTVETISK